MMMIGAVRPSMYCTVQYGRDRVRRRQGNGAAWVGVAGGRGSGRAGGRAERGRTEREGEREREREREGVRG